MSVFEDILGQPTALETLTRALANDHVHHAYRFEGIDGVGKERTAFALAQALSCRVEPRRGCGRCEDCRRVAGRTEGDHPRPLHPDVVLVGRGVYPPDTIGGKHERNEISVEQIRRVVLSRASYPPHEGPAQVFVVRDAEQLSIGAANALLKTLEEPRPDTHFILLTSQSERLLDTIRSRSMPVRFGPLREDVLGKILEARGVEAARIAAALPLAGGSAHAALEAADPEAAAATQELVGAVLAALEAPDLADGIGVGEAAPKDRRLVAHQLRALAATFVHQARLAARDDPAAAELAARRHELVLDALDAVEQRNASASLVLAGLVASLRRGWQLRPGNKPPITVQRR